MRKIKLTESSLIVTWFTQSHGKLKTVAKGARRPKSPFAGRLDLFFAADITFSLSRRSELHSLREVELRDPREGLRKRYERTLLAAYFVELTEMTTEFEHPAPEIYDLLKRALDYLDQTEPTRRAMLHFEGRLGRLLGGSPAARTPRVAARPVAPGQAHDADRRGRVGSGGRGRGRQRVAPRLTGSPRQTVRSSYNREVP